MGISFVRQGLKHLKEVGTITRSSSFVSKMMVKKAQIKDAKFILELGAGDGAITQHILDAMQKDARLMIFEVNPEFCKQLRKIPDNRLIVVEDTAERLQEYMQQYQFPIANSVVSAIPFVMLSDQECEKILKKCQDVMNSGSYFVQIHYSLMKKKLYQKVFGEVKVKFQPLNLPPAFILYAQKS
ncbi:MAG: hypothetical protein IPK61_00825 [Saprospiraceae bacterium]|jgi:phospholipid N-methyltransferase|nr:hypothetical protein [Saprospiraceae bacterium]MBK9378089.1 hypothetical protein [Saprospiraceae bacterium]